MVGLACGCQVIPFEAPAAKKKLRQGLHDLDPRFRPKTYVRSPGPNYKVDLQISAKAQKKEGKIHVFHSQDWGKSWKVFPEEKITRQRRGLTLSFPGEGSHGVVLRWQPDLPGPGTEPTRTIVIDNTPPQLTLLSPPGKRFDPTRNPVVGGDFNTIRWSASDDHLTERPVSIEYTLDGKTWTVAESNIRNTGEHRWEVPKKDMVGVQVRLSVQDLAGNVTSKEFGKVDIDGLPPFVKVVSSLEVKSMAERVPIRYLALDQGQAGLAYLAIYARPNVKGSEEEWRLVKRITPRGRARRESFVTLTDGSYDLVIEAVDRVGNRTSNPFLAVESIQPAMKLLVDTTRPVFEPSRTGTDMDPKRIYKTGDPVRLTWKATDANLAENPVVVSFSAEQGKTWQELASALPAEGSYVLKLPKVTTRDFRILLTAADRIGNIGKTVFVGGAVIGQTPQTFITYIRLAGDQIQVEYWIENYSGIRKLEGVDLYYRPKDSKGAYRRIGKPGTTERGQILVSLPPGTYEFVARSRIAGADEQPPIAGTPPDKVFPFYPEAPKIELVSFLGGKREVYRGGATLPVRWKVAGGLQAKVGIEYSLDGGKTYKSIMSGLEAAKGSFDWLLPEETTGAARLRATVTGRYGAQSVFTSPAPFGIDSAAPEVAGASGREFLGKKEGSRVRFVVRVADRGPAGLAKLTLWYRGEGASGWMVLNNVDVPESFTSEWIPSFVLPQEGTHRFHVTGTDRVGLAGPEPTIETQPHYQVTIDNTDPEIRAFSFAQAGGKVGFPVGEPIQFTWDVADRNMDARGVKIEWSLDPKADRWSAVSAGLSATGSTRWIVPPQLDRRRVHFRLSAVDRALNRSEAVSAQPVLVGFEQLSVTAAGPTSSRSRTIPIRFDVDKIDSRATLSSIEIYYSADNGNTWLGPQQSRIDGKTVVWKAPGSGDWGIILRASDSLGNGEPTPTRNDKPELKIVVDDTPPQVKLLGFDGGDVYFNGPLYTVRWEKALDENLGRWPMTVRVQREGSDQWEIVRAKLPNTGSVEWKVPDDFSARIRFQVEAVDEFGNRTVDTARSWLVIERSTPAVNILAPAQPVHTNEFELVFRVSSKGKLPVHKVVVYRTSDGGKRWVAMPSSFARGGALKELGDGKFSVMVQAFEGENGFWVVAYDRAGNHNPLPEPGAPFRFSVVVDSREPVVQLTGKLPEFFAPGQTVKLAYKATEDNPAVGPVSVDLSADGGRTWPASVVKSAPDRGFVEVKLPDKGGRYVLRLSFADIVGQVGRAVSGPFEIDATPPVSAVQGPKIWLTDDEPAIQFETRDTQSGVAAVELWFRREDQGRRTWNLWRTVPYQGQQGVKIKWEDGVYGLLMVAVDRVGNREAKRGLVDGKPAATTPAEWQLTIAHQDPQVRFEPGFPNSREFWSGKVDGAQTIGWRVVSRAGQYVAAIQTVNLYWARGGVDFELLKGNLPAGSTSYVWAIPTTADYPRCYLKIEVVNQFGKKGSAISNQFGIDNTSPRKPKIGFRDR